MQSIPSPPPPPPPPSLHVPMNTTTTTATVNESMDFDDLMVPSIPISISSPNQRSASNRTSTSNNTNSYRTSSNNNNNNTTVSSSMSVAASTASSSTSSSLFRIRNSASTMFERVMGQKQRGSNGYPTTDPYSNNNSRYSGYPTSSFIHSIREEDGMDNIGSSSGGGGGGGGRRSRGAAASNSSSVRGGGGGNSGGGGTDHHNHHHSDTDTSIVAARQQQQQQERRNIKCHLVIKSLYWQIAMIVFAVLLLFGDTIRTLFLPPILDNTLDVIFISSIIFFLIDITIRIYMEEDYYFTIPKFLRRHRHHSHNHQHHNNNNNINSDRGGNHSNDDSNIPCCTAVAQLLTCGSFLFWCDFLSTLSLMYDVRWINVLRFRESYIHITLDSFGIPISGIATINEARPIEVDPQLLITILQSARVARFIRSSTAVKISSKVNWFYIINLCNPLWWFQRLLCINNTTSATNGTGRFCCRRQHPINDTASRNGGVSSGNSVSGSMAGVSPAAMDGGSKQQQQTRVSTLSSDVDTGGSINSSNNNNTSNNLTSWTTLGDLVMAAVRTKNNPVVDTGIGNKRSGLLHMVSQRFGPGRSSMANNEDIQYHLAAMRIQRAWRAVLHSRSPNTNMNDGSFSDIAWKGRMSHSSIRPSIANSFRMMSFSMNHKPPARTLPGVTTTSAPSSLHPIATSAAASVASAANSISDTIYKSNDKRRNESQVGSAMRELTAQRVAIGIMVALLLTVVFTYSEQDATRPTTMMVLHSQTRFADFANKSLNVARMTSVPDLYSYQLANGEVVEFNVIENGRAPWDLRPEERVKISVTTDELNNTTIGYFSYRSERREEAIVTVLSTLFIVILWFFGITAFAGPVMVLVVIPIERMVRLLGMLMIDPLGYQSTSRYKRFVDEESEITKNTRWTREILKGMETSFLMSTILRIGSLMKVGFGSAGVEIIRNNLEKGQSKNMLILSSQGSTVSCIFLFCDIRNFTDATECLQEEVFVFTNRIAAVVHSNVHSYGGSANKNVGDAFLLSWLLDEDPNATKEDNFSSQTHTNGNFTAKSNQADKCLLSVVKICVALYHDDYYIGAMTEAAREALVMKLQHRKGPIVQMGFGMHAGRAVQGAIGSQRKIDATYVSEAVERAEFLESSTKRYGVPMLMSDSFHRLLHPSNRRRCRKVDQILIQEDFDDDNEEDDRDTAGDILELFTFDIDVASLWAKKNSMAATEASNRDEGNNITESSRRGTLAKQPRENRRSSNNGSLFLSNHDSDELNSGSAFLGTNSTNNQPSNTSGEMKDGVGGNNNTTSSDDPTLLQNSHRRVAAPTLVLPTGPALYNANVWTNDDMRTMRQLYSDGLFFQNFMSGLQSYYTKDWDHATQCFTTILQRFEDGPSRYFLSRIEEHNGTPPKDFVAYGIP